MRFRLTGGKHTTRGKTLGVRNGVAKRQLGKEYRKGDVIESAVDLRESFPGKFELLPDLIPAPSPALPPSDLEEVPAPGKAEPEEEDSNGNSGSGSEEELVSSLGESVQDEFPEASDKGLAVFQKASKFFISSLQDLESPLSSSRGMSRASAKKFVKDYEPEEEGE